MVRPISVNPYITGVIIQLVLGGNLALVAEVLVAGQLAKTLGARLWRMFDS